MRDGARDTWVIFSEELRGHTRSRWYLISTVVVVVLLVAAMVAVPALVGEEEETPGTSADYEESVAHMGFVDETSSFAGLAGESGPYEFDDRAQGLQALSREEIEWLYVIPDDYLETGEVEQYGEFAGRFPSNPAGESIFSYLLTEGLIAERVDPEVTARVLAPAVFQSYLVGDDGSVSEVPPTAEAVGGLLVPLLFAGLLGIGLAVGAGNMVRTVSEEKESRLVEVVITSVSPSSFITGKLLAVTAVGLAQAAVWIITAAITIPVMFHRTPGLGEFTVSAGMWLTVIGCFITGYFLVATLAIFVGAIAPSSREATGFGGWVSMVEFIPVWFAGVIMWQPDELIGRILSYFPFTASNGILVRLSGGGDMAAWKIALALAGVAVMGVIVLWISIRVFRAAILMRGQSFTAHNVWRAVRRAE